jgi:ribokinase
MARVTVVGSLNMDLVTQTERIPAPGETVLGGDLATVPGGKGANQAVAAARIGAQTSMVGHLGEDGFAAQLRQSLVTDNIDVQHVTTVDAATGVALIVVDASGQNSIVVASGANMRVTPADIDAAAEAIGQADVLLLQLEIPLESVVRAAEIARENGVIAVLNPAPAQPLSADLLALIDIVVPNESETATLTGLPVDSEEELTVAAQALRDFGIDTVLLTLGERGVLLADGDGTRRYPAFTVDKVTDTTAAGDAFLGGFATAIAEGRSVADAVPWGCASGALAVTKAGAQPSLPSRSDVQQLLSTKP